MALVRGVAALARAVAVRPFAVLRAVPVRGASMPVSGARFAGSGRKAKGPRVAANQMLVSRLKSRTTVMLVSDEGRVGEMTAAQALQRAQEAGMDLVGVALGASPPVVKLSSLAQVAKKEQAKAAALRAVQRTQKVKEVNFSCRIETHDLETKVGRIVRFLGKGNSVRVAVRFAPRVPAQMQEAQRRAVMQRVLTEVGDAGLMVPASLSVAGLDLVGTVIPTPRGRPADDPRVAEVLERLQHPFGPGAAADPRPSEDEAPVEASPSPPTPPRAPRRKKPKGSPVMSRAEQEEWRRGVGVDLEVEAELDEAMDMREPGRRGGKGRRVVAQAPVGSGRENSGSAGRRRA